MRLLIAPMTALLFFFDSAVVASTTIPGVDEVLGFTPDRQFAYVSQLSPQAVAHFQRNSEELARLLLEISGQNNSASELAMHQFNWFILSLSQIPCAPGFLALSKSEYVDEKLTQLITQPEFDMEVRRGSILAHANLFPPAEQLLEFYKDEIEGANPDERGLTENILIVLDQYRETSGIELPSSVQKKLPHLLNHRSGGVRNEAISLLSSIKGSDFLPDLFEMLQTSNYNSSLVIVTSILLIDSSQETIDRLKKIGDGFADGGSKKTLIERSILPENIQRLEKNRETGERTRNTGCAE